MPELPEVETMVRSLRPVLEGRKLLAVRALDDLMLVGCTARGLELAATGASIDRITRRGKWVVFSFKNHTGVIVIQPRMTGGFWLVPPPRHDHVRLIFEVDGRGDPVWFCDTRRLGKIAWHPDSASALSAFARSHGPDALEITEAELAASLKKTTRGIKPTLMDQHILAGVGNIYADEILFQSGIHPERPARGLRRSEVAAIHASLTEVLTRAIAAEGTSFDAGYRTVLGLEGGFLAQNAMYGRAGQPCKRCGNLVEKTKIPGLIGRPTYLCRVCQPRSPGRRPRASRGQGSV